MALVDVPGPAAGADPARIEITDHLGVWLGGEGLGSSVTDLQQTGVGQVLEALETSERLRFCFLVIRETVKNGHN